MMKKQLLIISLGLALPCLAAAQITINQSDFAQAGDSIYYGYDTTNVSSNLGSEGGTNRVWDFSSAAKDMTSLTRFLSPNQSPIPAPQDITHVIIDGEAQDASFINLSSSLLETVFPNPAATFIGGEQFIRLKSITFPATYLTQVRDTFSSKVVVPAATLGIGSLADSVRITFTVRLFNRCDGWGNLKTPTGTYASLRFKNEVTIDFKFEGKKNIVPIWFTIPTSSLPLPFPSNQVNTGYIWVHQNGKYFLGEASMVTDDANTLDEFRYQIPAPVNNGLNNYGENTLNVSVYPVPANDRLTINFNEALPNGTQVDIYNLTGKLVYSSNEALKNNGNQLSISTAAFDSGIYFLHMKGDNKEAKLKFTITH